MVPVKAAITSPMPTSALGVFIFIESRLQEVSNLTARSIGSTLFIAATIAEFVKISFLVIVQHGR